MISLRSLRGNMRTARTERGFTLVELVIAISILSVILTVAYSSLSYIIRTKKLLDDRRDVSAVANAVLLRVSREIQLAADIRLVPPSGGFKAGTTIPSFEGLSKPIDSGEHGDTINFMAQEAGQYVPGGLANVGTVMIRYRVEKDPDSPRGQPSSYFLIRDEVPDIRPTTRAWERLMTFPIAKNVVRFELSYYDSGTNRWNKEWSGQKGLPALVRMLLALRSPAGVIHEYMTVLPVS
jgi:prepilin-type N-terminal cleavage/methylation domain-containing protein